VPGVFDQIGEDRKELRRQQDALFRPAIAATPETLVLDVEPECTKHFHRRPGGQMSISMQHGGHSALPAAAATRVLAAVSALTFAGKLKSFTVCCCADDEVICLIDRGNRVGGEGGPSRVSLETLFRPRSRCSFFELIVLTPPNHA
jgi:hypothetical protein